MTTPALTPVDELILRAVNRFRYLTAAQLNRLLWPNNTKDANRYAQRRLATLVQHEYVQVLDNLPKPATGTAPKVHTLGWRGRKTLAGLGETVPFYYRPSEAEKSARNAIFMPHTLAVVDVLVAAERLTHEFPDIALTQLWTERALRQLRPWVVVPGAPDSYSSSRRVTVVPDAVFSLSIDGVVQDFVLEVDRGTERQPVWRRKVAALTLWIASDASAELLTDYVTVMVVRPSHVRREALRTWTAQELLSRNMFEEYAGMFVTTCESPVDMSPAVFFGGEHWHPAGIGTPDSLIDLVPASSHP